jgi:rhamnosyltransferase
VIDVRRGHTRGVTVGVVIRARDEGASIGRLLDLLARQELEHDLVLVDSGSADRTPDLARRQGARVIEIAPEEFSFGGALNLGAAEVRGDVVVSLSAHAYPRDDDWLARMVAWFADPAVACAFGDTRDAEGGVLAAPVRQDAAALRARPEWGYSNGAGAFRRSLWEQRPFRADMPGTEDREWSLWALEQGGVCVIDPALAVDHDHSRDPLRAAFDRYRREARGYAMFLDLPAYGLRHAAREWWSDQGWHRSAARARLDPRRAARLAGKWAGRR